MHFWLGFALGVVGFIVFFLWSMIMYYAGFNAAKMKIAREESAKYFGNQN